MPCTPPLMEDVDTCGDALPLLTALAVAFTIAVEKVTIFTVFFSIEISEAIHFFLSISKIGACTTRARNRG